MTKQVRIENADMSGYKLVVEVWDKGQDGKPDVHFQTSNLDWPTAMASLHVTSTRYLVVRENGSK